MVGGSISRSCSTALLAHNNKLTMDLHHHLHWLAMGTYDSVKWLLQTPLLRADRPGTREQSLFLKPIAFSNPGHSGLCYPA